MLLLLKLGFVVWYHKLYIKFLSSAYILLVIVKLQINAAQHPPCIEHQKKFGIKQRFIDASIQSVFIHLIALYLALEKDIPLRDISKRMACILETGARLESINLSIMNL